MNVQNAFDNITNTPCPVCTSLAWNGELPREAVMPLPEFPALSRESNKPCCRDCQAADTMCSLGGHPQFQANRIAVGEERIAGFRLPSGMMTHMGLCGMNLVAPCSQDDYDKHLEWLQEFTPLEATPV